VAGLFVILAVGGAGGGAGAHADVCDLARGGSAGVVRAACMAKGRAPS